MKRTVKIIAILSCFFVLLSALASCGARTMIKYEDKTLSVNVYEFLLSRMKGTLGYYGYEVENESFWNTVVDMQGTTYDDYFRETIKEQAVNYVVAEKLFEEYGLALTEEHEARIDSILENYVKNAGSVKELNAELKGYGVNYEMLREIYLLEAKMQLLKEHLYGVGGEKISDTDKESYFNESYVAFRQIFIATYEYVIDEDRFGDQVYYTDESHKAIAYDTEKGHTETDEFGNVILDVLKNPEYIYIDEDGKKHVAYDKENGVLGYLYTESGERTVKDLSDEEKAELYDKAQGYVYECNGNVALFEEYIGLYDESESGGVIYLNSSAGYYATQNQSAAYFDEIANVLEGLKAGEVELYKSSYGYHVLCRYENESGAYDKAENKDVFTGFYDDLITKLFDDLCRSRADEVEIDESVFEDAPSMKEVGINVKY